MSEGDRNQPDGASHEDLEDLYENAPCGYLSMQPDGRISKVNATLAAWTGLKASEMVGKRLQDILTAGTRIFYETHAAPLLSMQGYYNEVALDLKTAAGKHLPVFANAVRRQSADGRLLFTRLTLTQAQERRRYEHELVEAREAARAAEARVQELLKAERETAKLREQFIAVLGHDLRNPLASIAGGASLLTKCARSEREKRIINLVQGSVVRMSALIDNIMDFARGRLGGGITLARDPDVSLEPVLLQVVEELRTGVHHQEIRTEFALTKPVDCDPFRIGQLVSNLLGNALTHGAPDLPVRVYAATEEDHLEIWVANGGKPIPAVAMEKLFEPFFRGEVRPSQQGLGLGLHIASQIASAHGGILAVTSSDEETRFTFRMPSTATDS